MKKKLSRILAVTLALSMTAALAGCGSSSSTGDTASTEAAGGGLEIPHLTAVQRAKIQ